jgi:hypothetical protein
MKKLLTLMGILMLAFVFVGCEPKEEEEDPIDEVELDLALSQEWDGLLEGETVYLTTTGQADIDIVENIILNGGTEESAYTRNPLLLAADVEDGAVVVLVVGSSAKGLGAAGTDVNAENVRAQAFAAAANAGDLTLIVVHVGGVGRRGDLSDTIITSACGGADLMLVVVTGNADQFFDDFAGTAKPLYQYSTAAKLVPVFTALFG